MPANTSKNITYPVDSDNVDNLNAVFATLASSVDSALGNYVLTSDRAVAADVTAGTSTTKVITPKALADAGVTVGDTGWVDISSSVAAATGFTKDSGFVCRVRKVGNVVTIYMNRVTKTSGSALGIPVNGDISNRQIINSIPVAYRPSVTQSLSAGESGRANSYVIQPDGTIDVAAMVPAANQGGTANCPTGERFSCGGTYIV